MTFKRAEHFGDNRRGTVVGCATDGGFQITEAPHLVRGITCLDDAIADKNHNLLRLEHNRRLVVLDVVHDA